MGLAALREKQLVRWRGRTLRLDGRLPGGFWHLTDILTGLMDKQADADLWRALETGELKFGAENEADDSKTSALFARLSEAATPGSNPEPNKDQAGDNAVLKLKYVEAIRGLGRVEAIASIAALHEKTGWPANPPGYSTVMLWRQKSDSASDKVRALRDKHSRKGRRGPRFVNDVLQILRDVRDELYLCKNPRISIAKATHAAQRRIRLKNATRPIAEHLAIPKRKAMIAVINEIDAIEVVAARYGADVAIARMRASLGGVKVSRPLQRVEVDHTVLAVIVLDDDFQPLGRAFLTAAKDVCSRAVLGMYMGFENPSICSLARCLRHCVQPKIAFLEKYPGVKNDWICFGVPEEAAIDNGFEEHASALKQAASEMGIQYLDFCSRGRPWEKAHIERYIRQQDQDLLQELPGATMENIINRSDFDPKKDILLRWSTFQRIMVKWIVDIYMQRPQKCLKNRSPSQAWKLAEGTFQQFIPTQTTLLERLFLRLEKERSLDHEGIEYDCLIYNSLDLKLIREKLGARLRVNILVSDEDLGFIYVEVPGYDCWVKVPCLAQGYATGRTRWQHEKCKRMQRACADDGLELSLAEAWQQIHDDIAADSTALKLARKKVRARLTEQDEVKNAKDSGGSVEGTDPPSRADDVPNSDRDPGVLSDDDSDIPEFEVERLGARAS